MAVRRKLEGRVNPVATLHHQKRLKILRERLTGEDYEAKISEVTIIAVLNLAGDTQLV